MRIDFNYKKDGFYQIFPILYIKKDKERALVIGFGTNNISFVSGKNLIPVSENNPHDLKQGSITFKEFSGINNEFDNLSYTKKLMYITLSLSAFGVIYYLIKKRK